MTDDEKKKAQMIARNAAICAYYVEGHKPAECASKFKLGRQRVEQILKKADVWHPYDRSNRTKFLGVSVTAETKAGLLELAKKQGVSVSKMTSDALDEMVTRVDEMVTRTEE